MLGNIDYVQRGRMQVAHRPGNDKHWEISRDGYTLTYVGLSVSELMDLRDALNDLHIAIYAPNAPLAFLAPPVAPVYPGMVREADLRPTTDPDA